LTSGSQAVVGTPSSVSEQSKQPHDSTNFAYLLKDGATALHRAASNGHEEVVTLLIDAGAPVNAQDFVSFSSHTEETDYADLNSHLQEGNTALHLVVSRKHRKVAGSLIQAGAQVDITNEVSEPAHYLIQVCVSDQFFETNN
jgi:ankyrin repeat protein